MLPLTHLLRVIWDYNIIFDRGATLRSNFGAAAGEFVRFTFGFLFDFVIICLIASFIPFICFCVTQGVLLVQITGFACVHGIPDEPHR